MLDNLTQRLGRVAKTLRGEARLTDANIQEALREVRMALLEADVALPVVRDFIAIVREKAIGSDVAGSLTPGQAFVGIVQRELTRLIGGPTAPLDLAVVPPAVILLAGLQGSGKTTSAGKLARLLRQDMRKKVLLVSCDVYRPAAIAQLETLAGQVGVDFFPSSTDQDPVAIALSAVDWGRRHYHEIVIVDTAGRLAIDDAMMREIAALHAAVKPVETLFVVDAMQGQDAVNTAKAFGAVLPLTGVILTKLDGDARGGAALSVRQVTGAPIKFAGVSRKARWARSLSSRAHGDAHPRHGGCAGPDRGRAAAGRCRRRAKARQEGQVRQRLRPRGLQGADRADAQDGRHAGADRQAARRARARGARHPGRRSRDSRLEGIINAMTPAERAKPEILKASRKRRIAAGAGASWQEVNRLLAQFEQTQKMMKMVSKGGIQKMMR
jgi:signal recognition particle subunit SRP54